MILHAAILVGLVLASTLTEDLYAETAPVKKTRVQVNINGQEDIKGSLAQLVQEAFAELPDVELVTEKPALSLELIGVAPRNEKKEPVVFLVSVLGSQHFSKEHWNRVYATVSDRIPHHQSAQIEKSVLAATKDLIRKQSYYVEGGNDLRAIAKKIVTTFHHDQVDLLRKK